MRSKAPGLLLLLLLVTALALPSGAAHHCNGTIVTIPAGDETFYVDDRSDAAGEIDHWVYQETNGEPGLQSGRGPLDGPDNPVLSFIDPCQHINPDGLIVI